MTYRIRWSDNDRYFGPFTYARDSRGYRPIAVMLDSADGARSLAAALLRIADMISPPHLNG